MDRRAFTTFLCLWVLFWLQRVLLEARCHAQTYTMFSITLLHRRAHLRRTRLRLWWLNFKLLVLSRPSWRRGLTHANCSQHSLSQNALTLSRFIRNPLYLPRNRGDPDRLASILGPGDNPWDSVIFAHGNQHAQYVRFALFAKQYSIVPSEQCEPRGALFFLAYVIPRTTPLNLGHIYIQILLHLPLLFATPSSPILPATQHISTVAVAHSPWHIPPTTLTIVKLHSPVNIVPTLVTTLIMIL